MSQWRRDHHLSRDKAWVFILSLCEREASYEQLDDLQVLNDAAFDALECLIEARQSLLRSLSHLDKVEPIGSVLFDLNCEVVSSLISDLERESEVLASNYVQALSRLLSKVP